MIAATALIGTPLDPEKVMLLWNETAKSATPSVTSRSPFAPLYGRTSNSIPSSAYQPFWSATKNPVWFVFGNQSNCSVTVSS